MSASIPIRALGSSSHHSLGSLPGSSPGGSLLLSASPPAPFSYQQQSPAANHAPLLGMAGASPPFRGAGSNADKSNPYLAAKKFWKRLCFDPALDPTEYSIGFIESVQQPERKSGVEAWSMRLHDRLMELPYEQFVLRFCGSGSLSDAAAVQPPVEAAAAPSGSNGGSRKASSSGAAGLPATPVGRGAGRTGGGGGPLDVTAAAAALVSATPPRCASPSPSGGGGSWALLGGAYPTSEETGSDVPYHRIAYFKHGSAVVWESEYHKRRLSELAPAHLPDGPAANAAAAAAAAAERNRRRGSRDGSLPPMPPSPLISSSLGSSWKGEGLLHTPLARINTGSHGGAGGSGARGHGHHGALRSPRVPGGGSDQASDDGSVAGDSDDGDLLDLLVEEDEEGEDGEDDEEEEGGGGTSGSGGEAAGGGGRGGGALRGWPGGAAAAGGAAAEEAPAVPQLPEEVWMAMLTQLGTREVCMASRTCRWLRGLSGDPVVWRAAHEGIWGCAPDPAWTTAVVRRMCRRSELRAARWLEARVAPAALGFPSTTCLQMDDSKVVSGDGNAVRLWSHATGRRIATLQGHPGRVTAVAFDDSLLISGCAGSVVKLWAMDELRCKRTLRGHEGPITSCCLLPTGIPVSGGQDGLMRLWDVHSGATIVELEAGRPVHAMQAHAASGRLVSAGGGVQLWDVSTATLLQTLLDEHDPAADAVPARPYTCVSYMGDLLAAGRQGEVALVDPRVGAVAGRLRCKVAPYGAGGGGGTAAAGGAGVGSTAPGTPMAGMTGSSPFATGGGVVAAEVAAGGGGLGLIAAAAAAGAGGAAAAAAGVPAAVAAVGSRVGSFSQPPAPCVGVQLDEWKLVVGFSDGRKQLQVYDIRALPKMGAPGEGGGGAAAAAAAGPRGPWHTPLMSFTAPARINCFQFLDQALLAGLEGAESTMWRFDNPNAPPARAQGPLGAGGAPFGAGAGSPMPPGERDRRGGSGSGLVTPTGQSWGAAPFGGAEGGFESAGGGGVARKEKKKKPKVAKGQTRYPKRNTK